MVQRSFIVSLAVLVWSSAAWAQEDAPVTVPPVAPDSAPAAAPFRIVLSPEARLQLSDADRARAAALESEGQTLYASGRYKEAIDKFKLAFEITQNPGVLYNIGLSHQQLESWQECVGYMERFLEKEAPGAKRDRAENTLKSCDARIERDQLLIIESDPSSARVFLDDRSKGVRGSTPFRNYVRPGPHTVWIELDGYEPIEQTIEIQRKEPFRMNLSMRGIQNLGYLYVDSTINGATVFIDGKNIGLTPLREPLAYGAGRHQIVVDRDSYTRFDQHVSVDKGKITTVDAYVVRTEFVSTWRSGTGWTANILGLLLVGGGVAAWQLSEGKFNDTQEFKDFARYEKIGYGTGVGLLALGTTLIVWDRLRDRIDDEHRNLDYGKPAVVPKGQATPTLGLVPGPTGLGLGLGLSF